MTNAFQARFAELTRKHKVPGASVAVLDRDRIETAVAGVVNLATRVRTTPDTLFQIGSITKVYTATIAMQLVDAELVELDAPVRRYIPELKLRDETAAATITVRQLLTHTCGIEGDYFASFGRGNDSIERYVASLADIGQIHPPGAMWSYSNSGYVVAGRLIEKVLGSTYEQALRDKLLSPAGLAEHAAFAEEAILHRTAAGHIAKKEGARPKLAKIWHLDRSSAPAGVLCATARDVIGFAKIHMNDGRADDGTEILSPDSVKAMQQRQVGMPGEEHNAMGLGWIVADWNGTRVLWHSGGTIGQLAFLYIVPDRRFALCVLTNSSGAGSLIDDVVTEVFEERLRLAKPQPPKVPTETIDLDLSPYAGTYERLGVRLEVMAAEKSVTIVMSVSIVPEAEIQPEELTAYPVDRSRFVLVDAKGKPQGYVSFLELDADGRPGYLFFGRAARRVP